MTTSGAPDPTDPIDADTARDLAKRAVRLERDLHFAQQHALRTTRQLHRRMLRDVRAAEERARIAEKQAAKATRRAATAQRDARRALAEVETMRNSSTWKAGRLLVAVPARLKRMGRS